MGWLGKFNVVRILRGSHAGKIYVLPNKCWGKNKLHLIRAEYLLCNVEFREAFWFATGLLRGETKMSHSPYVKIGKSPIWSDLNLTEANSLRFSHILTSLK